jgi:hypothetical protein
MGPETRVPRRDLFDTFPTIRVGDTVKVTDTYASGDVRTKTFEVREVVGNVAHGRDVYAYKSDPGHKFTRTWEIVKRGEIPEPQNLGTVVRFQRDGWGGVVVTLMKIPGTSTWSTTGAGTNTTGNLWTWDDMVTQMRRETYEVLSEGVAL